MKGKLEAIKEWFLVFKDIVTFFKKKKVKKDSCDDYVYEENNKKVFIRKNGDGVLVSSCVIRIVDPTKTNYLIRTLDISDAKPSAQFEPFEDMKAQPVSAAFTEYGFWYDSENGIVTDVEEYYEERNYHRKDDKRFISIRLILDSAKLKPGKSYKITLAFSVPGLYPISDGRCDEISSDRERYPNFKSSVMTEHMGQILRFAVYFEEGILFSEKPCGYAYLSAALKSKKNGGVITRQCEYRDNILYKKYYFDIDYPQNYEEVVMKWKIKNPVCVVNKK